MTDRYDVIVIGAGSAGTNVAWYARDNGLSVAVVESGLVGGACSYWACIPSKALLAPGSILAAARRVPGAAGAVTGEVDVASALARRDELIAHLDDRGQAAWLGDTGTELVRGTGRIGGVREVDVALPDGRSRRLSATRAVVVATGSQAAVPPIEGLADIVTWDSREATTAKQIPRRLTVLGGGVVGVEMAQAYRRLGAAEVTVVQRSGRILSRHDPWVSELLTEAFAADGIDVRVGTDVRRVTRQGGDGPVTVSLGDGSAVVSDELLVATGRVFNTGGLGLETLGLAPRGPLEVDDRLRVLGVDGDWLYAVGDVNGRALFTHQGKYQGRTVGDLVAGVDRKAWADHVAVPEVVFTDPEIAAVGCTAADAVADGRDVAVVRVPISSTAGAKLLGDGIVGQAQLVVDRPRRVPVGATFVGPGVGEMLHAATVAVAGEVTIDALWHAVPAFPTVSEVWLRLLEECRGL
jgi:pyruvate/2-oxoglutarate dehydrogenase complex dihydrolipoamide dehydrogenase (E3) component